MYTWKYKVGDWVGYLETEYRVMSRMVINGHLCYKLDNGEDVNENLLF
jgi:hypothetical protein